MFKKIDLDNTIKESLSARIPREIIKQKPSGRGKSLDYIPGASVIDILNSTFSYFWDWTVKEQWVQESSPFFNKNSKEKKETYKGESGAWETQGPIVNVLGTLTVHVVDENGVERTIKKDAYGSHTVVGRQSEQENIFKAASTDALKKAASHLGIALELYRDAEQQQFFDDMSYEDPWTEEQKSLHAEELEYISASIELYSLDEEGLVELVELATGVADTINPDNITTVYEYLKSIEEKKEE